MAYFILFVFGTIIGSFLNVVALRWPEPEEDGKKFGIKTFSGRSACPTCGKKLHWYELIPVLSFIFQKGKCRECDGSVSWQYPVVEILTGLIFVLAYSLQLAVWEKIIFAIVFCIYIVILVYDFRHKIIPDRLSYSAIILSLVFVFLSYKLSADSYKLLDFLAGPILFAFFGSIWFFSRGRAMGFGDAKLSLSVGFLLGAAQGFSAIVLAFWTGAAAALAYMALAKYGFLNDGKRLTMKSEIPFAPFIILGAWLSVAFSLDILHVG